jgi:hypothetical protein
MDLRVRTQQMETVETVEQTLAEVEEEVLITKAKVALADLEF